jgi:Transmembrane protein of unknown function (DUF3556)
MGFTNSDTFLQKPLMERIRILGVDWAENGFGSPKMVHIIYIVKLRRWCSVSLGTRWCPDDRKLAQLSDRIGK